MSLCCYCNNLFIFKTYLQNNNGNKNKKKTIFCFKDKMVNTEILKNQASVLKADYID